MSASILQRGANMVIAGVSGAAFGERARAPRPPHRAARAVLASPPAGRHGRQEEEQGRVEGARSRTLRVRGRARARRAAAPRRAPRCPLRAAVPGGAACVRFLVPFGAASGARARTRTVRARVRGRARTLRAQGWREARRAPRRQELESQRRRVGPGMSGGERGGPPHTSRAHPPSPHTHLCSKFGRNPRKKSAGRGAPWRVAPRERAPRRAGVGLAPRTTGRSPLACARPLRRRPATVLSFSPARPLAR